LKRARDYGDIVGGLLLIGAGTWFGIYALEYPVGQLRRMGPGFFPAVLGALVALFGVLVLIPALFRGAELPKIEWRPFFMVCAALLGFALAVERVGLVPATFVLVILASIGRRGFSLLPTLVLAAALAVIAVVIFSEGLGIPIYAFRWNF
jgi:hypothetical protein